MSQFEQPLKKKPFKNKSDIRKNQFSQTGSLIAKHIRKAAQKRGFTSLRIVTHWAEIIGDDMAQMTEPQRIRHGQSGAQSGIDSTLIIACNSAYAPIIQMEIPKLIERINHALGYNAIQHIKLKHSHRIKPPQFTSQKIASADVSHQAQSNYKGANLKAALPPATLKDINAIQDDKFRKALLELSENVMNNKE